ncbi:MAG TPA: amidophosphoribosyltransferase, partial [Sutterella sp.]|nr:amidophosphoribosyltransferase [Sutterella sp.]
DLQGNVYERQCATTYRYAPCIFEYIYLARPDSVIDGISVYGARLSLGRRLAREVLKWIPKEEIDVVMPIPDSSRPSAQALSAELGIPYVEGFVKNRYIGRTFIQPEQSQRSSGVRIKLNPVYSIVNGKRIVLVDDSIVRGTTMREIVRLARDAGAKKVFVASSAPRVCFPNVYGIDMPTRSELICGDGTDAAGVSRIVGADAVVFQTIPDMIEAVASLNPAIQTFDCSCFDGRYITGDVDEAYLAELDAQAQRIRARSQDA